ncbi:MAG: HIT domain-containing protein [Holosporales bacterium]|nr:HIT domain-containing protein [Holosporales bacterium]
MSKYRKDNVFNKILHNEIPYDFVAENEFALAFRDIDPKANVHVLVIPKGEFSTFYDFHSTANSMQIVGFYSLINEVISSMKLVQTGFKLVSRAGSNGGQEVLHFHVHILGGENVADMP